MKVHSFETFGAVDGPGLRFIVFLSGCPFQCQYCHNPDTWARPPAFEMTSEEVWTRAVRYRAYWGREGGLTASGGEPMLQAREVAELFQLAHAAGATTCLDTAAGCFNRADSDIRALLGETDTILLDLKLMNAEGHRRLTGADNAPVLDCARYLSEIGKDVWIRRVLVPGVTDDEDDLRATGDFIRALGNVRRVDVLPYHALGAPKWDRLGLKYSLSGVSSPSKEALSRAQSLLFCDIKLQTLKH